MTIIANRYELKEELGAGGMGTVYLGIDQHTQQPVAIKNLKREVADEEMIQRFIREGETLRRLNHPNIVKMLEAVQEDGQHYLVMELVTGGSLADLLQTQKPLTIPYLLELALDLSDALTRAHRLKVIHRDIKPANILLAEDGTPRLTDFGIARVMGSKITETGILVGTLGYLSPELLTGELATERSDIWALGVVLFEMVSGQRPFIADNMGALITAILSQMPPDLEHIRPDAPPALIDLIYRMLIKDPAERISSVRLVGAEIEALANGVTLLPATSPLALEKNKAIGQSLFETPTPTFAALVKHNLPHQSTPFVGREVELQTFSQWLKDPQIRLITILGVGGMGKTRLALELGQQQLVNFADGVFVVELAPLPSPEHILTAIAEAVKYSFQSDERDPHQQLLDYFREKNLLLILDNFEHLISGALLVDDLLKNAPNLKIIATSREKLNLSTETLFALDGLDLTAGLDSSAAHLFIQTAKRLQANFAPQATDQAALIEICQLVYGMPLGIVLAAGWVEMLTVSEIAAEIRQSLDFLESEQRDLPTRQRSLRGVFDYSWALLSEEERAIFRQLAVFRGGFTRQAVQAITGANLRQLATLVNKSLLRRDADSGRYQIHELLRQYAYEQMKTLPHELAALNDRHSAFYLEMVANVGEALFGKDYQSITTNLELELENIRAGWNWALEVEQFDRLVSAIGVLADFHEILGWFKDALPFFDQARRTAQGKHDQLYWLAVSNWAACAMQLGLLTESEELARQALAFYRTLNDPLQMAENLNALCYIAMMKGDFTKAEAFIQEALQLITPEPEQYVHFRSWANLGYVKFLQGDSTAAKQIYNEMVTKMEAIQFISFLPPFYNNLGEFHHAAREDAEAKPLFERALTLYQQLNNQRGTANVLTNLGNIAHAEGSFAVSLRYYQQSLAIYREVGDRRGMAESLKMAGEAYFNSNEYAESERNYQAALTLYRAIGDKRGIANTLTVLGFVKYVHGKPEGIAHVQEGLTLRQEMNNLADIADSYFHLSNAYIMIEEYELARKAADNGLKTMNLSEAPLGMFPYTYLYGMIALYQEQNLDKARTFLEQNYERIKQVDFPWALRISLALLAEVYYLQGEGAKGQAALEENFHLSLKLRSYDWALFALVRVAQLLVESGEIKQGIMWMNFAQKHPYSFLMVKRKSSQLLTTLETQTPPEVFAAALAESQGLELVETLQAAITFLEQASTLGGHSAGA